MQEAPATMSVAAHTSAPTMRRLAASQTSAPHTAKAKQAKKAFCHPAWSSKKLNAAPVLRKYTKSKNPGITLTRSRYSKLRKIACLVIWSKATIKTIAKAWPGRAAPKLRRAQGAAGAPGRRSLGSFNCDPFDPADPSKGGGD